MKQFYLLRPDPFSKAHLSSHHRGDQACWHTLVIATVRRLRQRDCHLCQADPGRIVSFREAWVMGVRGLEGNDKVARQFKEKPR